jgi:hypothetical protein
MAGGLGVPRAVALPYAHTLVGAAEGLANWWLTSDDPDALGGAEPADALADLLVTVVGPGLAALTGRPIASSAAVSDDR